jgi:dihydrofolate reductase
MLISLIAAAATNNAIGINNQLLWHLPNDMRFFKNTTWAMPVVMGRKTFESLGSRPLPGRLNIIITRQPNWESAGTVTVHSVHDAILLAKSHDYKELFIAGGGEIYQSAVSVANKIYLTRVHTVIEADTFFPVFDTSEWQLKTNMDFYADSKHAYDYSFQVWEKG